MTKLIFPSGVEIHGRWLRIVFPYRGMRCREPIKGLAITKANINFAKNKRAAILHEIGIDRFDYANHFPDSPKCKLFDNNPHKHRSVDEALNMWLEIKRGRTAHSTYVNYKSKANSHVRPRWGNYELKNITRSDLNSWIATELNTLSNKTINDIMTVVRGIYKDAKADRILSDAPTDNLDNLPLGDRDDPDPFTRAEIDKILRFPTKRTQEIYMMGFGFWTGLRISELIALAWEDINFSEGTIRVRRANVKGRFKQTKTKRSNREVELIQPALEWLEEQRSYTEHLPHQPIELTSKDHKKKFTEHVRLVFLNSNTGQPHNSDNTVRDRFWRAHLKHAQIRYRGPNHIRHTFISQLLTAGIPKEWIVRQVGHTSTKMIDEHYGKWIREDAPGMANYVSRQLGFSVNNAPGAPQKGNENIFFPLFSAT